MSDAILVALITGGLTLLGTVITVVVSHRQTISTLEKNSAIADEKIQGEINVIKADIRTLSNRVEEHNKVVERTYKLERHADVIDEKISVANHRIDDLEREANHHD